MQMRSAYRAAGQENMHSYNLGIRLVRNADNSRTGSVTAGERALQAETSGKILIAYFTRGGNTRGIANEIKAQTGADLYEITLADPYSTDYNTVLMEAQEDQHKQARPKLKEHVQNMADYDIILLGSPNRNGSTGVLVENFKTGAEEAGHTVDVIDVCHADIHPCIGCVKCGYEGSCVQKDDVEQIRKKLLASDMVVFESRGKPDVSYDSLLHSDRHSGISTPPP